MQKRFHQTASLVVGLTYCVQNYGADEFYSGGAALIVILSAGLPHGLLYHLGRPVLLLLIHHTLLTKIKT